METITLTVTREELEHIIGCLDFTANDVSEQEENLMAIKAKLQEQAGNQEVE